jgi:electron transfer flavoprotein alpha subunit
MEPARAHQSFALFASSLARATHILTSTSATGKNILPRVGAHLDVQPITDVVRF